MQDETKKKTKIHTATITKNGQPVVIPVKTSIPQLTSVKETHEQTLKSQLRIAYNGSMRIEAISQERTLSKDEYSQLAIYNKMIIELLKIEQENRRINNEIGKMTDEQLKEEARKILESKGE